MKKIRQPNAVRQKFLARFREEYRFSLGMILLMICFFASVRAALLRFDFYSLTPVQNGNGEDYAVPKNSLSVQASGEKDETEEKIPYITDTRTVKEYRGVLGLYDCFDNLLETFDADLSMLPLNDRDLLREGVVFANEGDATDFIESLNS